MRARFSAPVQTGPGAHRASCTMGTGFFPGVKSGRGVTLTPHPFLVPWSRKGRAILLRPLWAVRPVQSLSIIMIHYFFISLLSFFYSQTVFTSWMTLITVYSGSGLVYVITVEIYIKLRVCSGHSLPPPAKKTVFVDAFSQCSLRRKKMSYKHREL